MVSQKARPFTKTTSLNGLVFETLINFKNIVC